MSPGVALLQVLQCHEPLPTAVLVSSLFSHHSRELWRTSQKLILQDPRAGRPALNRRDTTGSTGSSTG